jgi:hypothetical protein
MKKNVWIIVAVALAIIGVGTLYAMQAKNAAPGANTESGTTASRGSSTPSNILVPQGSAISMRLQSTISTKTAQVGDRFQAAVTAPVHVNGRVAIPEGSNVSGHVILARQPGKASGRGELQFSYDQIAFDGRSYNMNTNSQVYTSKSGTTKDVALIGGGAVAGGIVGGVLGGKDDIVKGAAVGGAAGTGASLLTRGPQLVLEQGTVLQTQLDQSMSVRKTKQPA